MSERKRKPPPLAPGYHVIGFCDIADKPRGREWCVYFRAADVLIRPRKLPSVDWLMRYAARRGYYPSGKIGAVAGRCDPVYLFVERVKAVRRGPAPRR